MLIRKKGKVLSLLLVIGLVLCAIPMPALAQETESLGNSNTKYAQPQASVTSGSTMSISGENNLPLDNGIQGDLVTKGWEWDGIDTILLGSSYSGEGIYISSGISDNFNLILRGDVTIDSSFWGINVAGINGGLGGSLTIQGGDYTLTVSAAADGIQAHSGLTIANGTIISQGEGTGLCSYYGDITILNSADVTVVGYTNSGGSMLSFNGIQADGDVLINTSGVVNASGGLGAISSGGTIAIENGTLNANGGKFALVGENGGVHITNGTVSINTAGTANGDVHGDVSISGADTKVVINGNILAGYSALTGDLTVSEGDVTVSGTVDGVINHSGGSLNGVGFHMLTVNSGSGAGLYKSGTPVTITSNNSSGQSFKEWIITPEVAFANGKTSKDSAVTFTMPNQPVTATAMYESKSTGTTEKPNSGGTLGGGHSTSNEGGSSVRDTSNVPNSTSGSGSSEVTQSAATSAVKTAVQKAKNSKLSSATVCIKNPSIVSLSVLQAMAKEAKFPVRFQADSLRSNGKTVDVRITLDPAKSTKGLNLVASTTSSRTKAVRTLFEQWYKNKVQVIELAQQGSFGQSVEISALLDLREINVQNLYIYSYDKVTHTYVLIKKPAHWIDSNGYLHFTTELAGEIIISDGALEKK